MPLRSLGDPILQVSHHLQHTLSQFASALRLIDRNIVRFVQVVEAFYRGHHCCGTCTERLIHTTLSNSLGQLLDLVRLHGNFELAELLHELEDGVASDARQNGPIQGRCDQFILSLLILPVNEEIHRAHLRHIVMDQPECLVAAMLFIPDAHSSERRRVITNI